MEHEHLKFFANSARFAADPSLMMPTGVGVPSGTGAGGSGFYPVLAAGDDDDDDVSAGPRFRWCLFACVH
jgi:hypothetical protein